MKIAIVAPSPVPFGIGGAEKLSSSLLDEFNKSTSHQCELIKLPSPEADFWSLIASYRAFSQLDLDHFDLVVSMKYPAWMVQHRNHVVYMLHRLRGLYDTYHFCNMPMEIPDDAPSEIIRVWQCADIKCQNRDRLEELFVLLDELSGRADLSSWFVFPGPLSRRIIHFMDEVGLSDKGVQRYGAISRTVADRCDYFPRQAQVTVAPPPSGLVPAVQMATGDYFFTVSRIDAPKRIGLLVEAMSVVKGDVKLKIAGVGPDMDRVKAMASNDPRIEFLGFLRDQEIAKHYAGSIAVPFVPCDEDLGLITFEAFMHGKPVITCSDSGGPTEFVVPERTGLIADPEPKSIAKSMQKFVDDRTKAAMMRDACIQASNRITWQNVLQFLVGESSNQPVLQDATSRMKIVVLSSFPVFPPRGGGQVRLFQLWRRIAQHHDVILISSVAHGELETRVEIAPGLVEVTVSRTQAHAVFETELSRRLDWLPITDLAFALGGAELSNYTEACAEALVGASLCVLSHPYSVTAIRGLSLPEVWYEAHNNEYEMKSRMYPDTPAGREAAEEVKKIETLACDVAQHVICVSRGDQESIARDFSVDKTRMVMAYNGVDLDSVEFFALEQRAELARQLGFEGRDIAIFMASWHGPNLEAVEDIICTAPRFPTLVFMIVGSACEAIRGRELPSNVYLMGTVSDEERNILLGAATYALNPMSSGGGSNLKLLDYMASGPAIVTSDYGARGAMVDPSMVWIHGPGQFSVALQDAISSSMTTRREKISRARTHAERFFSWDVITAPILDLIDIRFRSK